jgi:hypothetical protein
VHLHNDNFLVKFISLFLSFFLCLVHDIHLGLRGAFAGPVIGAEQVIESGCCGSVIVLPLCKKDVILTSVVIVSSCI